MRDLRGHRWAWLCDNLSNGGIVAIMIAFVVWLIFGVTV